MVSMQQFPKKSSHELLASLLELELPAPVIEKPSDVTIPPILKQAENRNSFNTRVISLLNIEMGEAFAPLGNFMGCGGRPSFTSCRHC